MINLLQILVMLLTDLAVFIVFVLAIRIFTQTLQNQQKINFHVCTNIRVLAGEAVKCCLLLSAETRRLFFTALWLVLFSGFFSTFEISEIIWFDTFRILLHEFGLLR